MFNWYDKVIPLTDIIQHVFNRRKMESQGEKYLALDKQITEPNSYENQFYQNKGVTL